MKTRLLIHGTVVFLILFAACLPLFSVAVAGFYLLRSIMQTRAAAGKN